MIAAIITALVVILDQSTKLWAELFLKDIGDMPLIPGVLHFTYHRNAGAAFGILANARWVFLVLTSVIIIGIVAYLVATRAQKKPILLTCSLGLILGGGIGNMIDRIFYGPSFFDGRVIDFINFELIDFAIFNVADSAVCIGEALLIIYILFVEGKSSCKKGTTEEINDEIQQ